MTDHKHNGPWTNKWKLLRMEDHKFTVITNKQKTKMYVYVSFFNSCEQICVVFN